MARREDGLTCGSNAWMSITDDEHGAAQTAFDQRGEDGAPMDLRLAQRYADAKDRAFAILADADGNKHCTVRKQATPADLLVTCIKDEIRAHSERTITPELKFHVELGRAGTHLRGADLMTAKFLNDFGDFAR